MGRPAFTDIDLSGDRFEYRFGPKSGFSVRDSSGRQIVETEGGLSHLKDSITNDVSLLDEGTEVCRIEAGSVRERLSGNVFSVIDAGTDEPVVEYKLPRSLTSHRVKAYDPDTGDLLAEVVCDDTISALLRESPLRRVSPCSYEVRTPNERVVGSVDIESLTGTNEMAMTLDCDDSLKHALVVAPYVLLVDYS